MLGPPQSSSSMQRDHRLSSAEQALLCVCLMPNCVKLQPAASAHDTPYGDRALRVWHGLRPADNQVLGPKCWQTTAMLMRASTMAAHTCSSQLHHLPPTWVVLAACKLLSQNGDETFGCRRSLG